LLQTLGLTPDILLVLAILVFAMALFLSNAIRVDVAAVLVLVVLGVFNLLPPEQLFSGFSSEAVISLIAIMIISAGLESTGISVRVARWMLKFGGEDPRKIILLLMAAAGLSASFMRSLGTVALFMPIVNRLNIRTGISKSFLLLPMAFCAILGGTLTMVGSGSLIVLNSLLKNTYRYETNTDMPHFAPFKLFDVLPIGLTLLFSGMLYLFLIRNKLNKKNVKSSSNNGSTKDHFKKYYGKDGDVFEIRVPAASSLVAATVKDLELKLPSSLSLICMMQDKEIHFPPLRGSIIKANSILAIMGAKEVVHQFAEAEGLKVMPKLNIFAEMLHPARAGLSEAVIPPSSQFVGKEARELHMRRNFKLHVLALCRGDTVIQGDELNKTVLRSGDTLGMFSTWEALYEFQNNPDFFVLTTTFPREKTYPKKIPYALFWFMLSISLVVFGAFPISVGLLLGAVGMIASGVLSVDQAYEKVSWKTVFFLAGLMPLGIVMQKSGTAEWLADFMIPDKIKIAPWIVQSYLAIASSLLSLIISPIGATVVLVPVAMDLAFNIGTDPRIYALTVSLATSNTFILQSNQVNSLITGPGNYSTKDFVIAGGGVTLIFLVIMMLGLHIFF
jgi:di/tricarboxylate transporter